MAETTEFFNEYKHISVIIHVLSVIVGMGAALVSDIMFNLYIKDKKINLNENRTLGILSNIVWFSLFFIVVSGLMLFLSNPIEYSLSVKFLVKMTIVGVIIINGYAFWHTIHPALRKINFTDTNMRHKYVKLRKASFAMGAVSLASWLTAFILGMLGHIPLSYLEAIVGYITICFGGILVSQIMEYRMTHAKT
ncbi:MAG: hypothetical protein AAB477_01085 [Patescibacteria group bacterium]